MKSLLPVLLLSACSQPSTSPRTAPRTTPAPAPAGFATATQRAAWHAQLKEMMERTRAKWLKHAPDGADAERGFHAELDRRWRPPASRKPKGLLQQSRNLWMVSRWHRETPNPRYRVLARNLRQFIAQRLCHTRPFCRLMEYGAEEDRDFLTYIHSFVIYSLSELALAFDDAEARALALRIFDTVEAHLLDRHHGGYVEHLVGTTRTGGESCRAGEACKSNETQLHLMEAFTALYEATRAPRVKRRLRELVHVIVVELVREHRRRSYMPDTFHRDWTPFAKRGDVHSNFGHDLQIVWLLWDTCDRVLGWDLPLSRERVLTPITRMGISAALHGFDDKHGGYYEKGNRGLPREPRYKDWWTQFEALQGIYRLVKLLRLPDQRAVPADQRDAVVAKLLTRFHRTLRFIRTRQFDQQNAGFFGRLDPSGLRQITDDNKVNLWKVGYHSMRGMLNLMRWLAAEGGGV